MISGLDVRRGDRVLVVRPGALGDAVLTLPLLQALRDRGCASIRVAGNPLSWSFLAQGAGIEVTDVGCRAWLGLFGGSFGPAAEAILATSDQAILCLRQTDSAVASLRRAGIARVVAVQPSAGGPTHAAPRQTAHAAASLLMALRPAPALESLRDWSAWIRPEGTAHPPRSASVLLHPGSGGEWKCWGAHGFAAVGRALAEQGLQPAILQGPADQASVERVRAVTADASRWPVLAGLTLEQLVDQLSCAAAFLGNDSGVSHLAARLCPSVVLFGPTDPRVWGPLGPDVALIAAPAAGSLNSLTPELVITALCEAVDRSRGLGRHAQDNGAV